MPNSRYIHSSLSNNSKDIQVSVYTTILPEVIQEEVNAGPIPKKKKQKTTPNNSLRTVCIQI